MNDSDDNSLAPDSETGAPLRLEVKPTYSNVVGRNDARVGPDVIQVLELSPGDCVELAGDRTTVATVWRTDVDDWGTGTVLLDEFTRENAGVSVGETIDVRPAIVSDATSLTVQSSTDRPISFDSSEMNRVRDGLSYRVLTEEDIVSIRDASGSAASPSHPWAVRVHTTDPRGPVRVTPETTIEFQDPQSDTDRATVPDSGTDDAVRLPVREMYEGSVGNNAACIGHSVMELPPYHQNNRADQTLYVRPGDYVELTGENTTVARVSPTDKADWDTETILLDEFTRENAGVAIDDTVVVRPATVEDATSITVHSSTDRPVSFDEETVAVVGERLYKWVLVEGDIVPLPGTDGPVPVSEASAVRVVDTDPAGPVRVTSVTDIEMQDPHSGDSSHYRRRRDYAY
ncbi:hypothetical protein ACFPYI_14835 [Halomarina salina]|uniref:AAA family ATPase n=1 Tax=Halomarina salina TaxID=1872699 RepID=A0ABD5RPN4_9EURY|nr:hypothetical protein [Halomarina salina]